MQDEEIKNIVNNIPKLEWACRRGMLELDVLLGNFLREAYPSLSLDDKRLFVELLTQPDPELFAWLMGSEVPQDKNIANITDMIRTHAITRFQT